MADYPLVTAAGTVAGVNVNPTKLANDLVPIVEAFSKVVEQQKQFKLDGLDLGLAISTTGSIGFVTFGAEASISLHFSPR
jgi:hypothetical protein